MLLEMERAVQSFYVVGDLSACWVKTGRRGVFI